MKFLKIAVFLYVLLFVNASVGNKLDPEQTTHKTGYLKTHKGHGLIDGGTFKNPRILYQLPKKFDWRELGVELPIKNQGSCGSCWAFATIANLESAALIYDESKVVASEQEVVDCDDRWYGCMGGGFAGPYLVKNGVTSESLYPYKAKTMKCKSKGKERVLQPVAWYNLGEKHRSPTIDEMKAAIMQYGFISVAVGANARWDNYKGGTMKGCKYKGLNHMVNLVGWTEKNEWIMRNSWGDDWGDKGYAIMPFGCDGLGEEAAYVIIENELE